MATRQQAQRVEELWDGRLTAREIAAKIGRITAFDVALIARRLGLEGTAQRTRGPDTDWTDERVARLTELWNAGRSGTEIALDLGGVTRSAVIGKVHRLGLDGRVQVQPPKPKAGPQRTATKALLTARSTFLGKMGAGSPPIRPAASGPEIITMPPAAGPEMERCTLLQLREGKCRWPVGDPGAPDFFFCGSRTAEGLPYCTYHARVAYKPADRRQATRAAAGR